MENVEQNNTAEKTSEEIEKEKKDAEIFIRIKMQDCNIMGNNDYELPTLERLIEQVKNDEVSPEEAKKTAQQIFDAKQRD